MSVDHMRTEPWRAVCPGHGSAAISCTHSKNIPWGKFTQVSFTSTKCRAMNFLFLTTRKKVHIWTGCHGTFIFALYRKEEALRLLSVFFFFFFAAAVRWEFDRRFRPANFRLTSQSQVMADHMKNSSIPVRNDSEPAWTTPGPWKLKQLNGIQPSVTSSVSVSPTATWQNVFCK